MQSCIFALGIELLGTKRIGISSDREIVEHRKNDLNKYLLFQYLKRRKVFLKEVKKGAKQMKCNEI